jgi:predicted phage baseplate assembly protein
MPLDAPVLDDRTFAQLLTEARSRIPRYAPEWTDHNDSDPGITLLQLHAWLTELTLYRLNKVPELSYVKFLQLLGIQTEPAKAARVDVTFTPARADVEHVFVPAGTQVATAGSGDSPPSVFQLPQGLTVIGAKLTAVQVFDSYAYTDVTTANGTDGQWFEPFGPHTREGAALLLGFDAPLTVPLTDQTIDLAAYLSQRITTDRPVHCDVDTEGVPPPARLAYEYWNGGHWENLEVLVDGTRAFSRTGHLVVGGPGVAAKKTSIGPVAAKLYYLRIRLIDSGYDAAPRLDGILTNTAPAIQSLTARDEVLGGSDGTPTQEPFVLANRPVLVRDDPYVVRRSDGLAVTVTSVALEIDEGSGFEPWQEVPDLFASGPDDPHFTVDRTRGTVSVGNGVHGRIPVANPALATSNVVARNYPYGGGAAANVGAGVVATLQTFAEGISAVTNYRPASGGRDEESVADAKLRAPALLKARDRAVTAEDFELLATQTPGVVVLRAKALPMRHPKFGDVPIPGVVTVIVVPDGDGPAPVPGETTLQTVCRHLNVHRLVTSELYVVPPTYRRIKVSAEVVVRPDADLATVHRALTDALSTWMHPLRGGDDGTGWPFGGDIYYSSLSRVALQVPGVLRIRDNQLIVTLDGLPQPECRDLPIGPGALLNADEPDIVVSYQ